MGRERAGSGGEGKADCGTSSIRRRLRPWRTLVAGDTAVRTKERVYWLSETQPGTEGGSGEKMEMSRG